MKFKIPVVMLAIVALFAFTGCAKKISLTIKNMTGGDTSLMVTAQADSVSPITQTLYDGDIIADKVLEFEISVDTAYVTINDGTGGSVEEQLTPRGLTKVKYIAALRGGQIYIYEDN